jgi:hypothetical protein
VPRIEVLKQLGWVEKVKQGWMLNRDEMMGLATEQHYLLAASS